MYLTVFGNNASFPRAYGACACYLVEACGKKVLLDMGSGSLSQLQRTEDLAALDMIVVSHLHFDHMGDLFCAKYQLETRRAWGETVPKIPLLAPPGRSLAQGKCLTSARWTMAPASPWAAFA